MRGYRPRKKNVRRPKNIVVIVCEGEKTELKYFQNIRSQIEVRNANIQIRPVHGNCTAPMSMVNYAIDNLTEWDVDFESGDGVWCVFDVDENTDRILQDTFDRAKANRIKMALSNPCIELWFLIHFRDQHAGLERDQAKSEYRKYQPRYDGEVDNELLTPRISDATMRAKFLNDMHARAERKLISTASNPSSQIFKVIEFIQELVKKNSEIF